MDIYIHAQGSALRERDDTETNLEYVYEIATNISTLMRTQDWHGVINALTKLEERALPFDALTGRLLALLKTLRKGENTEVADKAHKVVLTWKFQAQDVRRREEAGIMGRSKGIGKGKGQHVFDCKNVLGKCVDFYDDGKCVRRNNKGNPKVTFECPGEKTRIYMYVYIYMCVYVYIYIYIFIYARTYWDVKALYTQRMCERTCMKISTCVVCVAPLRIKKAFVKL